MIISTPRLRLIPATAELVALEIASNPALGHALAADVPAGWPPEQVADALPWFLGQLQSRPELSGWLGWYGLVLRANDELPLLVASAGFFGLPENGIVEVGYAVLPQFQGQGYATEMVGALAEWALSQATVRAVVAETHSDNTASVRLLHRLGFLETGAGREADNLSYERVRDAAPA